MNADKVYKKYKDMTNMSCSEMKEWANKPCSYKASLDREAVKRNIRLQCKKKSEWNEDDIIDAKKAISYLSRAKQIKSKNYVKDCGMTKNQIALRNWAYREG